MRKLLLILFILPLSGLFAQADTADTGQEDLILTSGEFFELVRQNHPIALQARLMLRTAEAERLKASGAFDPKLFADVDQKYFDQKTYYRLHDYGVKVPAWFGLSAKAGYEVNDGLYLNPQQEVPGTGLWYGEVSLTLGQGLFVDERRAALRRARLMVEMAQFEVQATLNDFYREALNQYWQWYQAYAVAQVYEESVELARERFRQVRTNALIGEEPMIDTLEAAIQVQNRILKLQEVRADLITARQMLETYLWLQGQVPLELQAETRPAYADPTDDPFVGDEWLQNHPLLRAYDLKIDQLQVTQSLNRERLKPEVDISYKLLNQAATDGEFFTPYSMNNYAWGLGASFPIFLRKERAEIAKTKVKILETEYEVQAKMRELINKVNALQAELAITEERVNEVRRIVNNYRRLWQAEIIMFQNGESSLFLVNQREIKYLESREKLYELEAKLRQVLVKLRAAAGELATAD